MSAFDSLDAVIAHVAGLAGQRLLVGIAGAPGAGKSTAAEAIVAALPDAALVPMDGYHLPQARLRELGRRDRMGAPDTFDVPAFVALLRELRFSGGGARFSGGLVTARGFDRTREEPVPDAILIPPEKRIIVVEGNYLLHDADGWGEVAPLLDETFALAVDDEVRRERLIARHVRFGKSPGEARAWALGPDEANARVVAATASRADHEIVLL